jgi:nucleoside phosphorylase
MELKNIRGKVDFGIITFLEDELDAVLQRFPRSDMASGRRRYHLSEVSTWDGGSYQVATVRSFEQGTGEAVNVARDLLEELDPKWLLVVGIAGAIPASEFTLGDVIVSTRMYDFSAEAASKNGSREPALTDTPIHGTAADIVANLPAMSEALGDWSSQASIVAPRPAVVLAGDHFYGDEEQHRKAPTHRHARGDRFELSAPQGA